MSSSIIIPALAGGALALVLCLLARFDVFGVFPVSHVTARGLHGVPVRTSVGVAITSATALAWSIHWALGGSAELWRVICATLILMLTGLADDRFDTKPLIRLAIQVAVTLGLVTVWWAKYVVLTPSIVVFVFLCIVWFINLFNFMDGSDGLAASQTIIAVFPLFLTSIAGTVRSTPEIDSTLAVLLIACAVFLAFNWPRARLFMGDAGAISIPILIAGIVLFHQDPRLSGSILVIGFSPFIGDASLTLAIRLFLREKIWKPHRSHAYQLIVRKTSRHVRPLVALWAYGILWTMPLAALVASGHLGQFAGVALALLPATAACAVVQVRLRPQFVS